MKYKNLGKNLLCFALIVVPVYFLLLFVGVPHVIASSILWIGSFVNGWVCAAKWPLFND